jgi:ComF family protein
LALAVATQAPLCLLCRRGVYAFELARSYGVYDTPMVRAITLLKYQAVTPLGGWFAARLAELAAREPQALAADVVVPVPLHPTRLRERGYNQAELIARPLARRLRLPLRSYLLVRTRPRPDKLKLSRQERWRSVRGAYALRQGSRVDNLRVLLVDDVFTTGATLDACSRALRQAGAARVVALTAARVVPDWVGSRRAEGTVFREARQ